jgi:hypothetical protein
MFTQDLHWRMLGAEPRAPAPLVVRTHLGVSPQGSHSPGVVLEVSDSLIVTVIDLLLS